MSVTIPVPLPAAGARAGLRGAIGSNDGGARGAPSPDDAFAMTMTDVESATDQAPQNVASDSDAAQKPPLDPRSIVPNDKVALPRAPDDSATAQQALAWTLQQAVSTAGETKPDASRTDAARAEGAPRRATARDDTADDLQSLVAAAASPSAVPLLAPVAAAPLPSPNAETMPKDSGKSVELPTPQIDRSMRGRVLPDAPRAAAAQVESPPASDARPFASTDLARVAVETILPPAPPPKVLASMPLQRARPEPVAAATSVTGRTRADTPVLQVSRQPHPHSEEAAPSPAHAPQPSDANADAPPLAPAIAGPGGTAGLAAPGDTPRGTTDAPALASTASPSTGEPASQPQPLRTLAFDVAAPDSDPVRVRLRLRGDNVGLDVRADAARLRHVSTEDLRSSLEAAGYAVDNIRLGPAAPDQTVAASSPSNGGAGDQPARDHQQRQSHDAFGTGSPGASAGNGSDAGAGRSFAERRDGPRRAPGNEPTPSGPGGTRDGGHSRRRDVLV